MMPRSLCVLSLRDRSGGSYLGHQRLFHSLSFIPSLRFQGCARPSSIQEARVESKCLGRLERLGNLACFLPLGEGGIGVMVASGRSSQPHQEFETKHRPRSPSKRRCLRRYHRMWHYSQAPGLERSLDNREGVSRLRRLRLPSLKPEMSQDIHLKAGPQNGRGGPFPILKAWLSSLPADTALQGNRTRQMVLETY